MLFILLALAVPFALASCPNECSGHGSCNEYSACLCHRNWMGNDCSQRVCYFDRAFIDTPTGDMNADGSLNPLKAVQVLSQNQLISELFPTEDFALGKSTPATAPLPGSDVATSTWTKWSEAHFYAECSGKGVCQRESGQCACFAGYEGEGCTRLSCPTTTEASCSGHGTCHLFGDSYQGWDSKRTQYCKCDPGFTGVGCAERECPFGDDPVTKYVHETKICAGATLGTDSDNAVGTLSNLVGKVVYGSKTGAKGTIRAFTDTDKCVHVINEEFAMFAKEDDLYVESENKLLILAKYAGSTTKITSIDRGYLDTAGSAVVQQNAQQLIKIKKTATDTDTTQVDFSLRYMDEFGQSYNTESTLCKWGTAAERTACVNNVEKALEELPHYTTGNLRLEDATETLGTCYRGWCKDTTDGSEITGETTSTACSGEWIAKTDLDNSDGFMAKPVSSEKTRAACGIAGTCSNPSITNIFECAYCKKTGTDSNTHTMDTLDPAATPANYVSTASCPTTSTMTQVASAWCKKTADGTHDKFKTTSAACGTDTSISTWETTVTWTPSAYAWASNDDMSISVYFYDNSGPQQLLTAFGYRSGSAGILGNLVVHSGATSDATIKVTTSTDGFTELASCSNRGLCDYSVGLCKCFPGFTGDDCSQQNVLAMH